MNNNYINDQRFLSLARSRIVVIRAIKVSLLVGTLLVAINQGHNIINMKLTILDWCRIILTYLVPYCVSTWSAVSAMKAQNS